MRRRLTVNMQNKGETINLLSVSIANYIAQYFTNDELEVLEAVFNIIGDALGVIAATRTENKNCTS